MPTAIAAAGKPLLRKRRKIRSLHREGGREGGSSREAEIAKEFLVPLLPCAWPACCCLASSSFVLGVSGGD